MFVQIQYGIVLMTGLSCRIKAEMTGKSHFCQCKVLSVFCDISSNDHTHLNKLGYSQMSIDFILRHKDVEIRHFNFKHEDTEKHILLRSIDKKARGSSISSRVCSAHHTSLNGLQMLSDEIEIRKQLNHSNIVSLFAVRESEFSILLC